MSYTRLFISLLASLALAGAVLAGPTLTSTPASANALPAPGPAVPAVADLNGDGIPDVVFSDFVLGLGVSVFLGKPGGGFQPAVRYATGGQADYVAIADFNHDGKLDLAVTNFTSNDVSILMGNGDGTFAKAVNYPTDLAPGAVVVGDFNHDGIPDLATSNQAPSMSVLLGKGDGTFAKAVNYPSNLGVGSGSADAADFDGDGNLDLLRGNYANSTIQIYRGRGDGTFAAPTTFSEGALTAWYGKAHDINGDGKPDILFSNLAAGTVSTLINKGDGTFGPAKAYSTGGLLPQCFDLGDLNGDGKLDMVVANGGSSSISVLLGTGNGTFGPPHTYPSGGLVPLSTPILADFNGDGKLDLVIGNTGSGNITLRYGNGDGTFGPPTNYAA
ncbi:VCBS repeat-containing protein [Nocardia sp. NEAU-G5]|uniref:VCBS repeat-containing protein n=1 Tax=Nocardia albiluteola TaxID=2842303 RepID=A0ABS6AU21_9NOCA|nr:VCBS repeat-containing protein [Nocardia albiluteola]MBU3061036.1 VCBS repeat-containing protein [Nocardia albiluteola]